MSGVAERREAGHLQTVARAVLRPIVRLGWRIDVRGLEHIPARGPAILCPNHISVLDSFFVPAMLPRRITYVGKAEYLDDWKTRWLFPALGMIPIDRTGGDAAQAALDLAARVLERGELFGIYPEGTRSRDGLLHKGRTGAARLALRTGAPIIPVGIRGTDAVLPPDRRLPRPLRRVGIVFGAPIDPARHDGRQNDRLLLRHITDEVMFEIRTLSGQMYTNTYAATGGLSTAGPNDPAAAEPEARSSAELLLVTPLSG
jgi:1-acyl-sn-glycerol-3-phosphate acyltransferase